jgi:hypothetical protein
MEVRKAHLETPWPPDDNNVGVILVAHSMGSVHHLIPDASGTNTFTEVSSQQTPSSASSTTAAQATTPPAPCSP